MKLMDRVKFQRPETGEICDAVLGWDTGEVQFLITLQEHDGRIIGPFAVVVTGQGGDGIFRQALEFTLDQQAKDVLRTLQNIAADMNDLHGNTDSTL